jgi:hypothetical protein
MNGSRPAAAQFKQASVSHQLLRLQSNLRCSVRGMDIVPCVHGSQHIQTGRTFQTTTAQCSSSIASHNYSILSRELNIAVALMRHNITAVLMGIILPGVTTLFTSGSTPLCYCTGLLKLVVVSLCFCYSFDLQNQVHPRQCGCLVLVYITAIVVLSCSSIPCNKNSRHNPVATHVVHLHSPFIALHLSLGRIARTSLLCTSACT